MSLEQLQLQLLGVRYSSIWYSSLRFLKSNLCNLHLSFIFSLLVDPQYASSDSFESDLVQVLRNMLLKGNLFSVLARILWRLVFVDQYLELLLALASIYFVSSEEKISKYVLLSIFLKNSTRSTSWKCEFMKRIWLIYLTILRHFAFYYYIFYYS